MGDPRFRPRHGCQNARRASERHVRAAPRSVRDRAGGLSPPVAVELSRREAGVEPEGSIFAGLRRRLVRPRRLAAPSNWHLAQHEPRDRGRSIRRGEPAVLIATFQRGGVSRARRAAAALFRTDGALGDCAWPTFLAPAYGRPSSCRCRVWGGGASPQWECDSWPTAGEPGGGARGEGTEPNVERRFETLWSRRKLPQALRARGHPAAREIACGPPQTLAGAVPGPYRAPHPAPPEQRGRADRQDDRLRRARRRLIGRTDSPYRASAASRLQDPSRRSAARDVGPSAQRKFLERVAHLVCDQGARLRPELPVCVCSHDA